MNFYKILGIPSNSSASDIKSAYRKLALKYHPDKKSGNEEKFKQISQAYDTLSDPVKRKEYDLYNIKDAYSAPFTPFSNGMAEHIFFEFFNKSALSSFSNSSSSFYSVQTTIRFPDGRVVTHSESNRPPSRKHMKSFI